MDPRWACARAFRAMVYATLSRSKGSLQRDDAVAIIKAIETFCIKPVLDLEGDARLGKPHLLLFNLRNARRIPGGTLN